MAFEQDHSAPGVKQTERGHQRQECQLRSHCNKIGEDTMTWVRVLQWRAEGSTVEFIIGLDVGYERIKGDKVMSGF